MRQPPLGKAGICRAEGPPRALWKTVRDTVNSNHSYVIISMAQKLGKAAETHYKQFHRSPGAI